MESRSKLPIEKTEDVLPAAARERARPARDRDGAPLVGSPRPDDASLHEAYRLLVSDLEVAARELRKRAGR